MVRAMTKGTRWRSKAACAGWPSTLFFSESEAEAGAPGQAKAICRQCPVVAECLDDALAGHERYGIWGGLTTKERTRLARRRRRVA